MIPSCAVATAHRSISEGKQLSLIFEREHEEPILEIGDEVTTPGLIAFACMGRSM
jgi:hypothetical protein